MVRAGRARPKRRSSVCSTAPWGWDFGRGRARVLPSNMGCALPTFAILRVFEAQYRDLDVV